MPKLLSFLKIPQVFRLNSNLELCIRSLQSLEQFLQNNFTIISFKCIRQSATKIKQAFKMEEQDPLSE